MYDNFSYIRDCSRGLHKDRFVYRYTLPKTSSFEGLTLGIYIDVPLKKVVYANGEFTHYHIAMFVCKQSYLDEHTSLIDDTDKFEETHRKAYHILLTEINKKCQIEL